MRACHTHECCGLTPSSWARISYPTMASSNNTAFDHWWLTLGSSKSVGRFSKGGFHGTHRPLWIHHCTLKSLTNILYVRMVPARMQVGSLIKTHHPVLRNIYFAQWRYWSRPLWESALFCEYGDHTVFWYTGLNFNFKFGLSLLTEFYITIKVIIMLL